MSGGSPTRLVVRCFRTPVLELVLGVKTYFCPLVARQELLRQHQAFLAGSGIDYMRGSAGPETPPSLAPPGRAAKVEEAVAAAEAAVEAALQVPPPPGLPAPSETPKSTEEVLHRFADHFLMPSAYQINSIRKAAAQFDFVVSASRDCNKIHFHPFEILLYSNHSIIFKVVQPVRDWH